MRVVPMEGEAEAALERKPTEEPAPAKEPISVADAQAALAADRKSREESCLTELAGLLARYSCEMRPEITLTDKGVTVAKVLVVAK